jgi:hypothetical protein
MKMHNILNMNKGEKIRVFSLCLSRIKPDFVWRQRNPLVVKSLEVKIVPRAGVGFFYYSEIGQSSFEEKANRSAKRRE